MRARRNVTVGNPGAPLVFARVHAIRIVPISGIDTTLRLVQQDKGDSEGLQLVPGDDSWILLDGRDVRIQREGSVGTVLVDVEWFDKPIPFVPPLPAPRRARLCDLAAADHTTQDISPVIDPGPWDDLCAEGRIFGPALAVADRRVVIPEWQNEAGVALSVLNLTGRADYADTQAGVSGAQSFEFSLRFCNAKAAEISGGAWIVSRVSALRNASARVKLRQWNVGGVAPTTLEGSIYGYPRRS